MEPRPLPKFMTNSVQKSPKFGQFGDEPCVLGIDEAGRGPVLGPMLYACAISPLNQTDVFNKLGFMDSKALDHKKREKLLSVINDRHEVISYAFIELSAQYISAHMLARRNAKTLNEISHESAIQLIKTAIEEGNNIKEVYVDTVGPKDSYQTLLKSHFPDIEITVSEKADSKYPIVSAASIVAKVTRDKQLEGFVYSEQDVQSSGAFGSGYPGDPLTKLYLAESINHVFGFNSLVRYSWKTAQKAMNKGSIKCAPVENTTQQSLTAFFALNKGPPVIQRHQYFKERKLRQTTTF